MNLYRRVVQRIDENPLLEPYRDIILDPDDEDDAPDWLLDADDETIDLLADKAHWEWVLTATVEEIVDWAQKTLLACESIARRDEMLQNAWRLSADTRKRIAQVKEKIQAILDAINEINANGASLQLPDEVRPDILGRRLWDYVFDRAFPLLFLTVNLFVADVPETATPAHATWQETTGQAKHAMLDAYRHALERYPEASTEWSKEFSGWGQPEQTTTFQTVRAFVAAMQAYDRAILNAYITYTEFLAEEVA
jgi:hypothetical protein